MQAGQSNAARQVAHRSSAIEHGTRRPGATFQPPVGERPGKQPAGLKAGSVSDSERQVTCEAILGRLDDYIDRELSPEDMRMVERHIEACLRCAWRYRFEISLIQEIRSRLRRIRVPGDLVARIKLRLDAEMAG